MLLYGNGASGNRSHADNCGKNIASGRGIVTGLIVAAGLVIAGGGIGLEKVALKLCGSDLKGCAGAEGTEVCVVSDSDRSDLNVGVADISTGLEFVGVGNKIVGMIYLNAVCTRDIGIVEIKSLP